MKLLKELMGRMGLTGLRGRMNGVSAANDGEISIANGLGGEASFAVIQGDTLFVPYGKYPHPLGLQLFDRASGEILQAAYNDLGKFPVYRGHPDVPGRPDSDPAAPAVGWGQGVDVADDGVRFPIKWGPEGEKAITNAEFRFYSPHWDLRKVSGGIQPVRMRSIGLTNNPRILVPAIANDKTTTEENTMPDWLTKMLVAGKLLSPEDATDESKVQEACRKCCEHMNNVQEIGYHQARIGELNKSLAAANDDVTRLNAEVLDLTGKLTAANDQVSQLTGDLSAANDRVLLVRTARIDAALDHLILGNKLTPADKDPKRSELLTIANDEELGTKLTEMAAATPVLKTKGVTDAGLGTSRSEILQSAANDMEVKSQARREAVEAELKKLDDKLPALQRYNTATDRVRAAKPDLFK